MGYPLLQLSFWGAIIALFLVVLRVPHRRSVRALSSLLVAACALSATLCVVVATPSALAIFTGLSVSFGLSGAILGWLGTGAAAMCAGLQLTGD
jgi:hypothetical protein